MTRFIRSESRFTMLFTLLVLAFLLLPFFIRHLYAAEAMHLTLSIGLVIGVYALSRSGALLATAIALVAVNQGLRWSALASADPTLVVLAHVGEPVFFSFAAILIVFHLFSEREITSDTIFAAVCAYLLLGLLWGSLYALIELLQPGSFNTAAGPILDSTMGGLGDGRASRFVYFSFVTLTTLGYGDITPASPATGTLAALEAVTGQLYVAILIARLVALHIAGRRG